MNKGLTIDYICEKLSEIMIAPCCAKYSYDGVSLATFMGKVEGEDWCESHTCGEDNAKCWRRCFEMLYMMDYQRCPNCGEKLEASHEDH